MEGLPETKIKIYLKRFAKAPATTDFGLHYQVVVAQRIKYQLAHLKVVGSNPTGCQGFLFFPFLAFSIIMSSVPNQVPQGSANKRFLKKNRFLGGLPEAKHARKIIVSITMASAAY